MVYVVKLPRGGDNVLNTLTALEYEILDYVLSAEPCSKLDVINHFDPQSRCVEVDETIRHLADNGFIAFSDHRCEWSPEVTPEGWHALSVCKEVAAQHAEQKAEKETDKAQAVEDKRQDRKHDYLVAFFSAVTGSLLTLLFEHVSEIITFIKNFLH